MLLSPDQCSSKHYKNTIQVGSKHQTIKTGGCSILHLLHSTINPYIESNEAFSFLLNASHLILFFQIFACYSARKVGGIDSGTETEVLLSFKSLVSDPQNALSGWNISYSHCTWFGSTAPAVQQQSNHCTLAVWDSLVLFPLSSPTSLPSKL